MRWLLLLALLAPPPSAPTSEPTTGPAPTTLSALLDARESVTLRGTVTRRLSVPETPLRQLREITEANPNPKVIARPDDAEIFDCWVPETTGPQELLGLLVFINPGGRDALPQAGYRESLAKYGIAWVAPRNVGNEKATSWRVWAALRAVQVFAAQYPLDPGRTYVSGMSGGGKSAMIAGLAFPEIFTGTLAMCGPAYDVEVPAEGGGYYPAYRLAIDPKLAALRKTRPFFLYTGDKDMNLAPTQRIADAMRQDGFKRVDSMVARDQGHNMVRGDELGTILYTLDAAARDEIPALLKRAATQEKAGHLGLALQAYRQALSRDPDHTTGSKEADALKEKYDADLAAADAAPANLKSEKLRQLKTKWGDVKFNPG